MGTHIARRHWPNGEDIQSTKPHALLVAPADSLMKVKPAGTFERGSAFLFL